MVLMNYYQNEAEEVFSFLSSSENGLTQTEAQKRLEKNGKNKLNEAKRSQLSVALSISLWIL